MGDETGQFDSEVPARLGQDRGPPPGELLGRRWRLDRELGRGGSSVVYAARDALDFDRPVAVKLATAADPSQLEAMRREFALLFGLRHPHIVQTLAYGESDAAVSGHSRHAPYLVQEHAPGVSARSATVPDPWAVAMQMAAALAALHGRGIRHGDVTPANILVDESGHSRLLDFGLASVHADGKVAGTLRYMAPEAMAGAATLASDLYGLGATLVHLLSGKAPDGPHGGVLESQGELIAALTASDPTRRPSAERTFSLIAEQHGGGDALRDLTLRSSRGHCAGLEERLRERSSGVVSVFGAPGSGRSAALTDGVARAVAGGLHVIGGRVLRLEHGLASLERELGLDGGQAPSEWARYEAIMAACTAPDRVSALFVDDWDGALTPFAEFVERGSGGPLILVTVQDRADSLCPEPVDLDVAKKLLAELRPLRPADAEAALALQRVSDGNVGAFVDLLQRYPGDSLLTAVAEQTLRVPDSPLRLPSELEHPATVFACFDDDLEFRDLGEAFPELLAAASPLSELGFLVPGATAGTLRVTRRLRRSLRPRVSEADHTRVSAFVEHRSNRLPATAGRLHAEAGDVTGATRLLFLAGEGARGRLEFEDALELYRTVLDLDPSHRDARVQQARLLSARGLHGEALRSLHGEELTVIEKLTLAQILSAAGRFGESAEAAPTDAQDAGYRGEAEAVRARALMLAGRYEDANNTAHLALGRSEDHPYRPELLDVLGMVAFYDGDIARARTHLEDSAAIAPDGERLERVRSHLGVVLHKAGALGDAEDAYRAAIEGARVRRDLPSQLLRQNNLATLLHERGRFVDALETYEEIEALAHVLGDKRASVRARMNWANLEGWLGQSESARARAGSALDDAEALEMTSETAYLRLIVSEQLIALGELEFAEDMLHLASEGLESSSIVYAEAQVVQAQLALRRQSPARAFELATAAYNRVEGRDLLRLISGSWVLQAALAGEKPLKAKVEPIGEALQSLAESRADPDYGWLIAAARAQLTDNASAVQSRTQLASQLLATARTRLSAQHERAYSELWWRADLWQGARSARPVADEITRDFDRLLAINRELARDHDPDRLLDRIIDAAIALSGAERGFIVLSADGSREPEEETLEVYLGRNLDRESLQGAELSRSIAARAIRTGGPVTTVDASGDDRFREALSVHELKLRSVLCLPLSTHGGALGALYLDNRYRAHAFSDADVSLLSAFGDQAAIALANARMVSELKTKANELERSRAEVDELNQRLQRELSAQAEELRYAKARNATMTDPGRYGMIGASAAMQRVYTIIERVADKDVTVAIVGESGTGKELVARAIHETSEQTHGAFVPVNCGAIPEQLLESELFGHERGAFTGAVRAKPGLFEVAENGTLFLDEIGDMPMSMQVKLLRVLQQREFRRVGGTDAIRSNARIISATHRNLEDRVREGLFREDLWYRLNVVEVTVPPLRERRDDLALLIDHFFEIAGVNDRVERTARAALLDYDWPGNVRELENEIQRATALAGDRVELSDLSERLQRPSPRPSSRGDLKGQVESFERHLIERALDENGGRVAVAAKALGLTRAGLYKKLHKYGLGSVDKR